MKAKLTLTEYIDTTTNLVDAINKRIDSGFGNTNYWKKVLLYIYNESTKDIEQLLDVNFGIKLKDKKEVSNNEMNVAEQLYLILQDLQEKQPELCGWLSDNGYTNLTVCPRCKVDDFVHVEGCKLIR